MNRVNLVALLLLFFTSGCKLTHHPVSFIAQPQQQDVFIVSEGNTLISFDNVLNDSLKGKKVSLKGKIHDTGSLNLFYTYSYSDSTITATRFFIDKRLFIKPYSYNWATLHGHYSKTGKDKIEISVTNFKIMDSINAEVEKAVSYSTKWVAENKKSFDLNEYKNTQRFSKALTDFRNVNLNHIAFEPDSTVTFIDFENRLIGINCGRHILRKTEQRSDFLCFHAIYDFKHKVLKKVIVQNVGVFLE